MSNDTTTSFLTYYIRSLAERTRVEKTSTKFGFDWIIYNLALADDLTPYRLPFLRGGADETSRTKTEPEFGIDCSFLSKDRQTLTIFVLKDEVLCNTAWKTNDFDADLRNAAAPNLTAPEFQCVRHVNVVLAYNKDEDNTGIQLFSNLTNSLPKQLANDVCLSFERWNLTTITEKVRAKLLTPSLLPQKFFSLFSYICSQFADFRHGSDAWEKQLVPNWRRFLEDVLKENPDERSVRIIPVALVILREHGKANASAETGWIDLTEWAMLAVWNVSRITTKSPVKQAIVQIWISLYLAELERFYSAHANDLAAEHSLDVCGAGSSLDSIISSVVAFWHLARMGVLATGYAEFLNRETDLDKQERSKALHTIANWLVGMLNANTSSKRPLLDIHHIELFLVWRTLWQIGRKEDIYRWLIELQQRLLVRRAGIATVPFLEGGNSLDLVFECVATNQKPPEFNDKSSLLILLLLELAFCLEPAKRNELIGLFYRQIVLAEDSNGEPMKDAKPIDLMGWCPPEDWAKRVLTKCLADEGESQTLVTDPAQGSDDATIATQIESFIRQSRTKRKFEWPTDLPFSVLVLACLKHHSPLPPELWRVGIFGRLQSMETTVGKTET